MIRVQIGEQVGEGETGLAALVACMLEIEGVEESQGAVDDAIAELGLDRSIVWAEFRLACSRIEEKASCDHAELEFSGAMENQRDTLVFHVNCRACGRSGSVVVGADDVLW